jgi:hypothetical protein
MVANLQTRATIEANFKRTMRFLAIDGFEASCVTEDLADQGMVTIEHPDTNREENEAYTLSQAKKEVDPDDEMKIMQARLYLIDPQVPEHYKQHIRAFLTLKGCKFKNDTLQRIEKDYEQD